MDVLDLHPAAGEEDELLGIGWKDGGMPCPVPQCGSKVFRKYNAMRLHWTQVHSEVIVLWKCKTCKIIVKRRAEMTRHYRTRHRKSPEDAITSTDDSSFRKRNDKYIDPGTTPQPQMQRDGVNRARSEAAERRRSEAEASAGSSLQRDVYVSRDQTVDLEGPTAVLRTKWEKFPRTLDDSYQAPEDINFDMFPERS